MFLIRGSGQWRLHLPALDPSLEPMPSSIKGFVLGYFEKYEGLEMQDFQGRANGNLKMFEHRHMRGLGHFSQI